jgi:hypothetical protein
MKTVHEELCRVISELEVICGTLDSLGKGRESTSPRIGVDAYYKLLFAFKGIRETIEILGELIKEPESVHSTT